jgi:hypothetical protein
MKYVSNCTACYPRRVRLHQDGSAASTRLMVISWSLTAAVPILREKFSFCASLATRIPACDTLTLEKTEHQEPKIERRRTDTSYTIHHLTWSRDGNGHEKSTYPRIPNPRIEDMGGNLCPRAGRRNNSRPNRYLGEALRKKISSPLELLWPCNIVLVIYLDLQLT